MQAQKKSNNQCVEGGENQLPFNFSESAFSCSECLPREHLQWPVVKQDMAQRNCFNKHQQQHVVTSFLEHLWLNPAH